MSYITCNNNHSSKNYVWHLLRIYYDPDIKYFVVITSFIPQSTCHNVNATIISIL